MLKVELLEIPWMNPVQIDEYPELHVGVENNIIKVKIHQRVILHHDDVKLCMHNKHIVHSTHTSNERFCRQLLTEVNLI